MSIHSKMDPSSQSLTIHVEGRFDFSSLQPFRESYESLGTPVKQYLVDLKNADYLDSSALGMLLALRDYAGGESANVKILNSKPDVKKILLITKLDELFTLE